MHPDILNIKLLDETVKDHKVHYQSRKLASLDKYLQEIGREDLITVEEEVELAQAIKEATGEHWRN